MTMNVHEMFEAGMTRQEIDDVSESWANKYIPREEVINFAHLWRDMPRFKAGREFYDYCLLSNFYRTYVEYAE